jgi:transposase-like protein
MTKRNSSIPKKKRLEILQALSESGCNIRQLATAYSISKTTLYKWQRIQGQSAGSHGIRVDDKSNFVELSVLKSDRIFLQKASLDFGDFSISIEGIFSNAQLVSILNTLEV